jgi:Domain of unknown function (DUF4345)
VLSLVLRLTGVICIAVALLHGMLGVSGDGVLGIGVPSLIDPSLDSQNRFYGVAFGLYGVLLWMGGGDVRRYARVLKAIFVLMFLAGVARGLAVVAHGWPTPQIIGLWASELILPPLLWLWLIHETGQGDDKLRQ